jgi:hypothetical protein
MQYRCEDYVRRTIKRAKHDSRGGTSTGRECGIGEGEGREGSPDYALADPGEVRGPSSVGREQALLLSVGQHGARVGGPGAGWGR